jgi:hypothetical protein
MKKKSTNIRKYEAPVAVAFVVIGLFLAYLVTTFTYGQDPDDGVIDFSLPTRTALANAAATDASRTQTNFGTKAAGIFSLFDSSPTPTLSRTATSTLTPTRTPGITEQATRRKREDPFTATPRPANTKPPATATKKPNPTSTGTEVPTRAPNTPKPSSTPMPPAGEGLISGSVPLQGSSANLSGSPFAGGVTDQASGSCSSYLCRLIALIFKTPGGW